MYSECKHGIVEGKYCKECADESVSITEKYLAEEKFKSYNTASTKLPTKKEIRKAYTEHCLSNNRTPLPVALNALSWAIHFIRRQLRTGC